MQTMLDELAKAVAPMAHPVVLMDQAGWHRAHALAVPDDLTLAFLLPYSSELNVIERVWLEVKERYPSHSVWPDYDHIVFTACEP